MAKTVLIVDDNEFIRRALCELFQREADFEVCADAENGREAIEMAEQLLPDLIVLDLSMPVMNGLDAARVLKRIMPTVPLIMYSVFEDRFVEQQARLIGISDVVSKSDPFSVLVAKAQLALSHSRLSRNGPVVDVTRRLYSQPGQCIMKKHPCFRRSKLGWAPAPLRCAVQGLRSVTAALGSNCTGEWGAKEPQKDIGKSG